MGKWAFISQTNLKRGVWGGVGGSSRHMKEENEVKMLWTKQCLRGKNIPLLTVLFGNKEQRKHGEDERGTPVKPILGGLVPCLSKGGANRKKIRGLMGGAAEGHKCTLKKPTNLSWQVG